MGLGIFTRFRGGRRPPTFFDGFFLGGSGNCLIEFSVFVKNLDVKTDRCDYAFGVLRSVKRFVRGNEHMNQHGLRWEPMFSDMYRTVHETSVG